MHLGQRATGAGDLVALFEDLEQQADGLRLRERDGEVVALEAAEYAEVDLVSRLHGSVGGAIAVHLADALLVRGRLDRVGADFCLVGAGHQGSWVVPVAAVHWVEGLAERAVVEEARPVLARLRLTSVLRRLADGRAPVTVHLAGGQRLEGRIGRVGRDFVEMAGSAQVCAVALGTLTAVRAPS